MAETLLRRQATIDPAAELRGSHDWLNPGDIVRFKGQLGTFRFLNVWAPDGSLSVFGPLSANPEKGRAQFRSFRPEQLSRRDKAAEADLAAVAARLAAMDEAAAATAKSAGQKAAETRKARQAAAKAPAADTASLSPAQRAWVTRRAKAAAAAAAKEAA